MTTPINKEIFLSQLFDRLRSTYSLPMTKNIMQDVEYLLEGNTLREKVELMDIDAWIINCCNMLNVESKKVFSNCRKRDLVYIRNAFAYILTTVYKLRQEDACKYVNLDRSTISSACKKVKEDFETQNQAFIDVYNVCYNQLFVSKN